MCCAVLCALLSKIIIPAPRIAPFSIEAVVCEGKGEDSAQELIVFRALARGGSGRPCRPDTSEQAVCGSWIRLSTEGRLAVRKWDAWR